MRTVEEQKKNLHAARLHPWEISNAIRFGCSLDDDDKEAMICTVNATYNEDAWAQYCALDTIVRDTLNAIIEETLYGKKQNNGMEGCPFCGNEYPLFTHNEYSDFWEFICPSCGLRAHFDYGSSTVHYGSKQRARAEALKKWNRMD